MGIHHDLSRFHQGGHTRRITRIFDKHQERCGIGHKSAVMGDTVSDGGHPEFTHAVVDVIPGDILFKRF
ncbi:hypothetical protein D3C80_1976670 [compost metagenome]